MTCTRRAAPLSRGLEGRQRSSRRLPRSALSCGLLSSAAGSSAHREAEREVVLKPDGCEGLGYRCHLEKKGGAGATHGASQEGLDHGAHPGRHIKAGHGWAPYNALVTQIHRKYTGESQGRRQFTTCPYSLDIVHPSRCRRVLRAHKASSPPCWPPGLKRALGGPGR